MAGSVHPEGRLRYGLGFVRIIGCQYGPGGSRRYRCRFWPQRWRASIPSVHGPAPRTCRSRPHHAATRTPMEHGSITYFHWNGEFSQVILLWCQVEVAA